MNLPTSNGVPYLPDGYGLDDPPSPPWPAWVRGILFALCYLTLQALYAQCAGTAIERFFLENLASKPAAFLLDLVQPSLAVQAIGTRITALGGGGINISNGCEGTDLYFPLVAAFVAISLPWHRRLVGLVLGLFLAFALNQARIVSLLLANRWDPAWFNQLHTLVAPLILIVVLALYFHVWLRHCRRSAKASA